MDLYSNVCTSSIELFVSDIDQLDFPVMTNLDRVRFYLRLEKKSNHFDQFPYQTGEMWKKVPPCLVNFERNQRADNAGGEHLHLVTNLFLTVLMFFLLIIVSSHQPLFHLF